MNAREPLTIVRTHEPDGILDLYVYRLKETGQILGTVSRIDPGCVPPGAWGGATGVGESAEVAVGEHRPGLRGLEALDHLVRTAITRRFRLNDPRGTRGLEGLGQFLPRCGSCSSVRIWETDCDPCPTDLL